MRWDWEFYRYMIATASKSLELPVPEHGACYDYDTSITIFVSTALPALL
jgi:hypothetical protein